MGAPEARADAPRPVLTFRYRLRGERPATIRMEALDARDHIFRTIEQTGTFYESDLLRYLRAILRPRKESIVIDVGANIGNHSVFFARHLASHVIAIEPNPDLISVLKSNLEGNVGSRSAWSIIEAAVGASEGSGLLETGSQSLGNVGMTRVRASSAAGDEVGARVTVTTLDRVVDDFYRRASSRAPVGLIKVDVEGMEAAVLEGARGVLERFAPDLVVEAKDEEERSRVEEVIRPFGYVAVSTHCATPTHHYVRAPTGRLLFRTRVYRLRRWLARRVRGLLPWPMQLRHRRSRS